MSPPVSRGGDLAWGGAMMALGIFFCLAFLIFDSTILLAAWPSGLPMIAAGYAVMTAGVRDRQETGESRTSPVARHQPFPPEIKREVWARDGGVCALCGAKTDLRFGHIGGEGESEGDDLTTLRVVCERCLRSVTRGGIPA